MPNKVRIAFALALIVASCALVLGAEKPSEKPVFTAGTWQVDSRHSDAQLITDGTTDYGKTKINVTLGFGRVKGVIRLDDGDTAKSRVDLHIYPASSTAEAIDEDGNFRNRWLANRANNILLCFHSKEVTQTADGRVQARGELTVVRVDRNVKIPPLTEIYYGPVYGTTMINSVSREATFVFDLPADGYAQQDGGMKVSGSTKTFRDDFPELVQAVLNTYWPPVLQEENCGAARPSEVFSGTKCTGTFLQGPSALEDPGTDIGGDSSGSQNSNDRLGKHLDIIVHLRLSPKSSERQIPAGN